MFTMGDWYERYNSASYLRAIDPPERTGESLQHAHLPGDVPSHSRAALDAQVHSLVHAMAASFAPPVVQSQLHNNTLHHETFVSAVGVGRSF